MQTLMLMYVIFSVVLIMLAIPLWLEKIPPNGAYGFRVKKTLENEKNWYAVNKYSAPWLFATGAGTLITAIGLYFVPGISIDIYPLVVFGVFLIILVPGLILTVRYMNTL
jgi:hypothetical protein